VTIPATVPQGSEIPEGLTNNRVDVKTTVLHVVGIYGIAVFWFLSAPPIRTVKFNCYIATVFG
jgi:hypothetical protein